MPDFEIQWLTSFNLCWFCLSHDGPHWPKAAHKTIEPAAIGNYSSSVERNTIGNLEKEAKLTKNQKDMKRITCEGDGRLSTSPSDLCPFPRSRRTGERLRGERMSSSMYNMLK